MTVAEVLRGFTPRLLAMLVALAGASTAGAATALPAGAEDSVRGFYKVLLATMKNGSLLGQNGRYAALAPVVNAVFDVQSMARLAVGPAWDALPTSQQQQLVSALGRYISATYADRFDRYSGEDLQVTGDEPYANGVMVETKIVRLGQPPVSINYLVLRHHGNWQISDVYLDGTISQLATQRSEFHSILVRQGADGLIATLERKVDLLTSNTRPAP
jgi:phospholipid transport system substrate-binding protein